MDGWRSQNIVWGGTLKPTKKKKDPNGPIRPWAALSTWIILNLIWFTLSPMGTPHPVLSDNGGHREHYDMTVPNVLGSDLPIEITCELTVSDSNYNNIKIQWKIWDKEKKYAPDADYRLEPEIDYSGKLEGCSKYNETIPPGDYELEIKFYSQNGTQILWEEAAKLIQGEFTMMYWIYAPHLLSGYIVVNILGLVILVTDQSVRRWKRAKRLARKLPLHKQRHKEEWETLHEEMDGGGRAIVESFEFELGSSSETERERMRERFAQQSEDISEIEEIKEETIESSNELGKGDTKGLEGEAEVDEDIHTVKDLWRKIQDTED